MTSIGKPYFIIPDNRLVQNILCKNPNAVHVIDHNWGIIHWGYLSSNPNATHILEYRKNYINNLFSRDCLYRSWLIQNPNAISLMADKLCLDYYDFDLLAANPGAEAISILETHLHWIPLYSLLKNPNAIKLIEKHPNFNNIDELIKELCSNPNALHILNKYDVNKLDWEKLSRNPGAIPILEENMNKVVWNALSENENAIHILEKHLDRINWYRLSGNPKALHILSKNFDKVNLRRLASNPGAIPLIEQHLDKINIIDLAENPNAIHLLTPLNTNKMKENMSDFKDELIAYVFDPDRMINISKLYNCDFNKMLYMY